MGLLAGKGLDKSAVNYRPYEKCLTCMHFYGPNSCDIVAGNISPEAVCDRWEMKEKDTGKDGDFYLKEYQKNPTKFTNDLPGGGR